jgi:hypothetical protein
MAATFTRTTGLQLARQAREQFISGIEGAMVEIAAAVQGRLVALMDQGSSGREMQERRDALLAFEKARAAWVDGTLKAWRQALVAPTATARVRMAFGSFELIGDEVVENKILSSRLALAVEDKVKDLSDLRLRIQLLEGSQELARHDVLRPEVVPQLLVEQWTAAGLSREAWALVQDVIQQHLVDRLVEAYRRANEFLISRGVMPEIDLKPLVKRTASGAPGAARRGPDSGPDGAGAARGGMGQGGGGGSSWGGASALGGPGGGARAGGGAGAAGGGGGSPQGGRGMPAGAGGPASRMAGGAGEETRMLTASTPLARARMRAQGVIGQLRRMLTDRVADFDMTHATRPSPALAEAMQVAEAGQVVETAVSAEAAYATGGVEQIAASLRQRTGELKKKAATSTEKATIEIVALMFQSILAEERIPAAVRVWFARLQMPVLRVALSEPEFFGTLQHPARQLIDRMGSCVMGFDAHAISGSALEIEIKRVVQVIEQYPETGRRVFQLVYDEFQKFLAKFLTEKGATQRLVSVAQQVEQKETMAIQYTIEMRNMLNDMPVRDEIREFLFKVWAEVLAVAAVKNGPQHADTIALKKSAADLVWAASAKPNRNDRARVIQDLPQLLQRLRQGMTLLGVEGPPQEAHIKVIGDTLADAFLSKTEAIPQARIDAMAQRLANLEDFVSDDGMGDLPLDADSIELLLGIDASSIEVVADGGSQPSDAMLAWAQELQPGTWFTLDHNGKLSQVQYAWRSDRKQLHLFASTDGKSFLIQARRLAAYLQAGLLVPTEEEALTVRATRDALAKLDANPERLLN